MELDKKKVILFSATGFLLLAFSLLLIQLLTFNADSDLSDYMKLYSDLAR